MNYLNLAAHLPWPLVAGFIAANVIPYLSALATKAPTWATGAVTALLSTANGFLSTWAAQGSHFDVRAALGAAAISFVVAFLHHKALLSGTNVQAHLHAIGNAARGAGSTPAQPAA